MRCTMLSVRVGLAFATLMSPLAPAMGAGAAGSEHAARTVVAQAQPARPPARGSAPAPSRQSGNRDDAGDTAGDAQLRQRVDQLEQQLSEMQVVIGTLESLARSPDRSMPGAAVSRGGSAGGWEQGRIDELETQVRALTSQLEQLSEQVRQLGGRRTDAGSSGTVASREPPPFRTEGLAPTLRSDGGGWQDRQTSDASRGTVGTDFGSVTVTPGPGRDPIGGLIAREPEAQPDRMASATIDAAQVSGNPKELYETAYGYLLQQDYGSAQASFEEFLRLYPSDRLAADAQYWLGEALYVQRRYKPAGQAFLKVIQNHRASAKVPNSLLKLAMTLEQLGQKDCALFTELESRHPDAAADVKNRAKVVRQRVGC